MNSLETIKRAKLALAHLGATGEVFKARYDSDRRHRLEGEDATKTNQYFEYVFALQSLIRRARYELKGYYREKQPGEVLERQITKRCDLVRRELDSHDYRCRFSLAEGKILVTVRAKRGRKCISLIEPLNAKFIAVDRGLVVHRDLIQKSSHGAIYHARYACLKTMTEKTGTFAEGIDGKLTRCAGLPSAKKHLLDVITKTYAKAM